MIALMAHLTVRLDKREELIQTLQSLVDDIKLAPGCQDCLMGMNGDAALLFSVWESRDSLEGHLRSEQMGILLGTSGLLAEPPRFRFSDSQLPEASEVIEQARREAAGGGSA
jgi:quinol monooxygenase YgiN